MSDFQDQNLQEKELKVESTGVNTSKFTKKVDLVNLKSNADKLDIGKLKNVPTNLSNLKSKVDELEDIDKLVPVLSQYLFCSELVPVLLIKVN